MKIPPCIAILFSLMPLAWSYCQSNTVGTIEYNPNLFADGQTLIYPHNQPHARLVNACGEVVHIWTNDSLRRPGNSAYLTPNGNLFWAHRPANVQNDPIWAGGGGAVIEARTWDNAVLWNYTLNDSTGRLHHDFALTNSGTVLAIAWERIDSIAAIHAGRNPELLEDGELWSERIIELMPNDSGGADIIWEWRVWDHLVQDFDSTKVNYDDPELVPNRVDINFGSTSSVAPDWLHINSIDYNPALGHILLSVPTFNELWIIDREEPDEGLIWRWGNPEAYDRGTSEDKRLYYQHAATWLDETYHIGTSDFGKIAVFNNRNPGATGPYSSAHLITPEFSDSSATNTYVLNNNNDTYAPVDFDWTWTAPIPTDFFSSGLSNFERLHNGNNLIVSGRTGEIFEFTATGDTAWYYRVPLQGGTTIAQGTELGMNDNLLFRAKRYPPDLPIFNSVELLSMGMWELEPNPLLTCQPCNLSATVTLEPGNASVNVVGANGAYTVIWSLDGINLCTGEELSLDGPCAEATETLTDGMTIEVVVVDEAGCEFVTQFNWLTSSVEDRDQAVQFWPNPVHRTLYLSGFHCGETATLYSLTGQIVAKQKLITDALTARMDVSSLPAGAYFLRVGQYCGHVIIRH